MKNTGSLAAIIALCLAMAIIVLFGSLKKHPVIAENEAIAEISNASTENSYDTSERSPEVGAIISDNGRLIIGAEDGIYVMPSVRGNRAFYKTDPGADPSGAGPETGMQLLNAILSKGENRYVGGNGLYLFDSSYQYLLQEIEIPNSDNIKGQVFALMDFGSGILIGTDNGLWYHCDIPDEEGGCIDTLVLPGVIVTAMVQDRDALWVGTYGDGLFRYDGSEWQQRFLKRDNTAFAVVNALEYQYPYLWVGTDMGLYRYDGGQWSQIFVNDSTDTFEVTSIMSTPAATYVGATDGLLRYASDCLNWVDSFDGLNIAGFCRSDKGVVVATRFDGIFTFNGKEELVSPEQLRLCEPVKNEDKVVDDEDPLWLSKGGVYVWEAE